MSLEDTPKISISDLDKGDKVCTVLPDHVWEIIPDELDLMNHHKVSQSFYVSIIPANPLRKQRQRVIIHLMPFSRKEELAPPEE